MISNLNNTKKKLFNIEFCIKVYQAIFKKVIEDGDGVLR